MNMNRFPTIISILLAAILLGSIPNTMFGTVEADGDTLVTAEAGASADYRWNEIHGFSITERDKKIGDTFNLSICEDEPKENKTSGRFEPKGEIYGELRDMRWNDTGAEGYPEPFIRIEEEVFERSSCASSAGHPSTRSNPIRRSSSEPNHPMY